MSEHDLIPIAITFSEYFFLGLTIFLGAIGSLIVQKIIKWNDEKEKRLDIVNGLLLELEANQEMIQEEDLTTIEQETLLPTTGDKKVKTTKTTIIICETSFFDSIVHSGLYLLLPKRLRKDLSEIYSKLNSSNYHADLLTKATFYIKKDQNDILAWRKNFDLQTATFQDIHDSVIEQINKAIKKLEKLQKKKKGD